MKVQSFKITLMLTASLLALSCNVLKRVDHDKHLITKSTIIINNEKKTNEAINNLISQKPNSKILNYPLRLHIYNLARSNQDSILKKWLNKRPRKQQKLKTDSTGEQLKRYIKSALSFNKWLKKTGQAPAIIDSSKIKRSLNQLKGYHVVRGWFDAKPSYQINLSKKPNRASINFLVDTGKPYFVNRIVTNISSPIIDSLYQKIKTDSKIILDKQWNNQDFQDEGERIVNAYRNAGIYHFSQDYVKFNLDKDTLNKTISVEVQIQDRIIKNEDSVTRVPFKAYKIKEVNIYTDNSFQNRAKGDIQDSVIYNNYNLRSYNKLQYRPKALTDAVVITKDSLFSDKNHRTTLRFLNQLNTFNSPSINYTENLADTSLTANIFLTPKEKYNLRFEPTISQNDIQSIGLAFNASLSVLNIFKGAETLQLSALGSVGASKDGSGAEDQFFDINEIGLNAQLRIPRLFFPFNISRIIPKTYSPNTNVTLGFTNQTNVGLDRQTFNGIFNYQWKPKTSITNSLDLFNVQFVRNLNPGNYFNVFQNSFNRLEDIALNSFNTPTDFIDIDTNGNQSLNQDRSVEFIDLVVADAGFQDSNPNDFRVVNTIRERRERLIENNLIFASSFEFSIDNRENISDTSFSVFRTNLELAGNIASAVSEVFNFDSNEIFGVEYAQYARAEFNYIKHWSLGGERVLAIRNFLGIALPYGNSSNIPFTRSFFAGGVNDNRAWTAFDLGPGSSNSNDEFNEANFKLAFSIENRFSLFGSLKGALFIDAGNIFNVLDEVEDPASTFTGFSDLQDIAIGSGFGFRYDFSLFVVRFDIGFKTYDPSFGDRNRWFNDYNFGNAIYNIGINYPF